MSNRKVLVTETYLEDIADAIRSQNGSETTYKPSEMAVAIEALAIPVLGTKTITANDTYDPADDDLDGYSEVTVNVPNSYAVGDEGKVVANGELVAQTARSSEITLNGTYDTTTNNEVKVNVSGGGGATLVSKSITENGTYNPADDNADGYNSVTVNVSGGGGGVQWNENILCNWDFANIVNTRGNSSYSSGYGYDGWSVYQGRVSTVTGGITLVKNTSKSFMLSGQFLLQNNAVAALLGKTLTISALVNDEFGSQTITITSSIGNQGEVLTVNGIRFYFYRDSSTQMPFYIYSEYEDTSRIVRAVKVEFGTVQTLAHQENGVWTLNKSQTPDEEYFRVCAMVRNS